MAYPKADSNNFWVDVLEGRHLRHEIVTINVTNPAVSTTDETLWAEGADYVFPTASVKMSVSSDSLDDTTSGSGAVTVSIVGLDSSYNEITETITLVGQTGVTTTNSFFRINSMEVLTANGHGKNVGGIFIGSGAITSGKPATVYNLVSANDGRSHSGVYTVPNTKNAYVVQLLVGGESTKSMIVSIKERQSSKAWTLITRLGGLGSVPLPNSVPTKLIPPKTDIDIKAKHITGSGQIQGFVNLLLVQQV